MIDEILLQVEKPARYIGNEVNMVVKNPKDVDIRFAFCFPDVYEVGMSHLGLQILYYFLNRREDTYCERCFTPWVDMEQKMRENNIPLFCLESGDELKKFDFVGFTLQYEMSYTNVLNMLDLANIPIWSKDRTEDDPIIIAGGPCAYNPEPLADIIDVFYIGEGEVSYDKFFDVYKEHKKNGGTKEEFLEKILEIPGMYVPKFYDVSYNEDGTVKEIKPNNPKAPKTIKKVIVDDMNAVFYPEKQMVPLIETVHDRVTLEVFRGCIRGCRFCQAGYVYRPVRERGKDKVLSLADSLVRTSGHEEIGLTSLSTGDYTEFVPLADELLDRYSKDKISISLPSLRIDAFSLDLMDRVQAVRKSGLTFAPEAGTQRLRDVINKGITEEEILRALRNATVQMAVVPMLCGSSFKNKGVQTLLDYVCAFLPSPLDTENVVGTNPETGAEEDRKPSEDEKTSALAFKIATDPYVGRLTFFRVYSGKIEAGSYIYNSRSGKKERVSRLFQMHSNKQNPVEVIGAGDIGAGVGFKDIHTGDTLCDETAPIVLESMDFPEPVIGIAVEPKTQKDMDKLSNGLAKLAEEDPTFTVKTDEQTGQTVISGMGELHLDIIIDRLKREFKVECNQGKPQVNYKEAITKTVNLREVYKKQSGGRGKFADIIVNIGPVDEDFTQGGLQFVDEVKGGNIPKEFIPSVQKGFTTAMKNGVLAGYPLDSLKVTLIDGSFHPVDSDQLSFEICAIQAYKNACAKAGPVLMEPIMKLEVVTPEENMGDVIGDLNKRRGQVEGMESSRSGARIVKAMVPLAEMFGYVTALRTITSGRATSSMVYSHHAQVSNSIAKAVLEEVKGRTDLI